jgi:hypothetical protein
MQRFVDPGRAAAKIVSARCRMAKPNNPPSDPCRNRRRVEGIRINSSWVVDRLLGRTARRGGEWLARIND